ncbi:MAG: hypothetical protein IM613_12780 [Cytophagales bacterium]|nr:hypothetical protein [Cytophagales bacterium]
MALTDNLTAEKQALTTLLESEYTQQNLRDSLLERLYYVRFLLGELGGGGGGGDASAAKQDEQTGYLTSISNDSSSIAVALGDTSGNPEPHTTAWYLKQIHTGVDSGTAQLPSSLGAKTSANSFSVALATDSAISSNVAAISGNVANIRDNVANVLPFIGLDTTAIKAQLPSSLGAKTSAGSLSVVMASDSVAYRSQVSLTRAANTTTYATNDVMFGAFELQNIGAANGFLLISDVRFLMNIAYMPVGVGNLRLFLYSSTPPSAVADNGAFSVPSGDRSVLLTPEGISLGTPRLANGGGSLVLSPSVRPSPLIRLTSTSLFGYLVTEGAWVPQANSETATLTVLGVVP